MRTHAHDNTNHRLAQLQQGALSLEEALALHNELEATPSMPGSPEETPRDLKAWLRAIPQADSLPPSAFDQLCLECQEGTASPEEQETLARLCSQYLYYAHRHRLLQACQLQPDNAIVYPHKRTLKRGVTRWPVALHWMGRAAVVALLFTAMGWYYWNRPSHTPQPEGDTIAQSAPTPSESAPPQQPAVATIPETTSHPAKKVNDTAPAIKHTAQPTPPEPASIMEPLAAMPIISPKAPMQLALAPMGDLNHEPYLTTDWETLEILDELADVVAWEELEQTAKPERAPQGRARRFFAKLIAASR